jgi:hypothetical protein
MSAQQANAGVLVMSNLNKFLVELHCGCFHTLAGTEVYFMALVIVHSTLAFNPFSHTAANSIAVPSLIGHEQSVTRQ